MANWPGAAINLLGILSSTYCKSDACSQAVSFVLCGSILPFRLIRAKNKFKFVEKLQNPFGTKGRTSIHRSGDHVSVRKRINARRGFLSDSRKPPSERFLCFATSRGLHPLHARAAIQTDAKHRLCTLPNR